jgi:tetratricopeptide (TPR) repeat protein
MAAIHRKVEGALSVGFASSLQLLASVSAERAGKLYCRSLSVLEKLLDKSDSRIGEALFFLGNWYESIGDFDKAESHLSRALSIFENTLGPSNSWMRDCVVRYASVLSKQDRLSDYPAIAAKAEAIIASEPRYL